MDLHITIDLGERTLKWLADINNTAAKTVAAVAKPAGFVPAAKSAEPTDEEDKPAFLKEKGTPGRKKKEATPEAETSEPKPVAATPPKPATPAITREQVTDKLTEVVKAKGMPVGKELLGRECFGKPGSVGKLKQEDYKDFIEACDLALMA